LIVFRHRKIGLPSSKRRLYRKEKAARFQRAAFTALRRTKMPQSAVALHFFTRYVKQAGALQPFSAVP